MGWHLNYIFEDTNFLNNPTFAKVFYPSVWCLTHPLRSNSSARKLFKWDPKWNAVPKKPSCPLLPNRFVKFSLPRQECSSSHFSFNVWLIESKQLPFIRASLSEKMHSSLTAEWGRGLLKLIRSSPKIEKCLQPAYVYRQFAYVESGICQFPRIPEFIRNSWNSANVRFIFLFKRKVSQLIPFFFLKQKLLSECGTFVLIQFIIFGS